VCEIHGGTIEIDESKSGGARFIIRLPGVTAKIAKKVLA